jgi:GNAT superfamily N-acetyltransferase
MELSFIEANPEDWEFIRQLRNLSRDGFFSQREVTAPEHREFMNKYGYNYFIATIDGRKVGFIGEVKGDVRLAVLPEYRGNGIATRMLQFFGELWSKKSLTAQVKKDNVASIKTFLKSGWEQDAEYITFKK